MTPKDVAARLSENCVNVVSEPDLVAKLERAEREHRPLRAKLGIDASGPDIHLGFAVVLRKLRQFQEFGHTAVLIVGDFTGKIGDPSGRSKTRPQLTDEQIQTNLARYKEQVFRILKPEQTEVVYNSEWSNPLTAREIIELAARITLARIIERDDFRNRLSRNEPVSLHEILYPLFQGYDSVAVRADVELGGQDQYWNLLVGRELQRGFGQEPQVVMTVPLLLGTDGEHKMSKSYGNYIGVCDTPDEIYGKTMSIPDRMLLNYFELAAFWSKAQREEVETALAAGDNPRNWKDRLAREIITLYHNREAADQAAQNFARLFREHKAPADMPEFVLDGPKTLVEIIVAAGLLPSKSEARRKIAEGGIYLDDQRVTDPALQLTPGKPVVLKVGKRHFCRIVGN